MNIYRCSECGQMVFFENVACAQCGAALAFLPDFRVMSALAPSRENSTPQMFVATAKAAQGRRYRPCENGRAHGVCNWAVPAEDADPLCSACRFNTIIPNLSEPGAKRVWQKLEHAKRRLLYTLYALGLPLETQRESRERGLAFAFMADDPGAESKVYTGHSNGLITINIAEADDPYRERTRNEMGEAYRTLLGHFRHEIGHYYWDRLIRDTAHLEAFRALFGDERQSYAEASQRHYEQGAPKDWPLSYVSAYASMHPWEDWAETWAHYLHMVDTLETARSYDLLLRPKPVDGTPGRSIAASAVDREQFEDLITAWVPLTVALNHLNRSMGLPDLYPFVLSEVAIRKLRFVHGVIEGTEARVEQPAFENPTSV